VNDMRVENRFFIIPIILAGFMFSIQASQNAISIYGRLEPSITIDRNIQNEDTFSITNGVLTTTNMKLNSGIVTGFAKLNANYNQNTDIIKWNLQKAFILCKGSFWTYKLGKDRESYGVGYLWNPADLLNPQKSPLYRDSERRNAEEGIFMSSLSVSGHIADLWFEIKGIYLPLKKIEDSKAAAALKLSWNLYEFAFITSSQLNDSTTMMAGYLRGSIPGLDPVNFYSEMQLADILHQKYLFGIQLTPPITLFYDGNIQITGEYFFNNNPYDEVITKWFSNNDTKTPMVGEIFSNYVYGGLSYYMLDFVMSCGYVQNLDSDQSGMINVFGSYSIAAETQINIGGYIPFGDSKAEFPFFLNKEWSLYFSTSHSFELPF